MGSTARQEPTFTGGAGGGCGLLFATSDVMVTDGRSMLLEYQIAEKLVILIERRDHRPVDEILNHMRIDW